MWRSSPRRGLTCGFGWAPRFPKERSSAPGATCSGAFPGASIGWPTLPRRLLRRGKSYRTAPTVISSVYLQYILSFYRDIAGFLTPRRTYFASKKIRPRRACRRGRLDIGGRLPSDVSLSSLLAMVNGHKQVITTLMSSLRPFHRAASLSRFTTRLANVFCIIL